MKDWTDIIGKELESIREPLPADDWQALQQKYTIFRNRRKRTTFVLWGAISSVAATIILALLLFRPHPYVANKILVAEMHTPTPPAEEILPYNPPEVPSEEMVPNNSPKVHSEKIVSNNTDKYATCDSTISDKAIGKSSQKENTPNETTVTELRSDDITLNIDDFPQEEHDRHRYPISIGVSGTVYGVIASGNDAVTSSTPVIPPNTDSLVQQKYYLTKGQSSQTSWKDTYEHKMPISFGISARFMLSDIFAVNTGLNYTQYTSIRKRFYYGTNKTESDKQNVHYIGLPVRFDLLIINKKAISLYIGGGIQVEKCIYATVGNERLREKPFIWSASAVAGLQLNITSGYGIFFEPEISTTLNCGTIETFRSEKSSMKSFRAGFRFNF